MNCLGTTCSKYLAVMNATGASVRGSRPGLKAEDLRAGGLEGLMREGLGGN
jgi:hypothetical protein